MTRDDIAKAIETNAKCTFDGCKYIVVGYQRFKAPGDPSYDSMLLTTDTCRTLVHAPIDRVELEATDGC